MDLAQLEDVRYEVERGLAWITINRPERFNSFRGAHRRRADPLLQGGVGRLGRRRGRAHRRGRQAFCAGGDQKQRHETGDYGPTESGRVRGRDAAPRDPRPAQAGDRRGERRRGRRRARAARALRPHDRRSTRALRPGRAARRLVRRRLRQRVPGAHPRREARARGLVPVPALRRRDHGALGPRERGGAERGAARRGAPLGGRDARQESDRAPGA